MNGPTPTPASVAPPRTPRRVATYYPMYQDGGGHSATCLALCEHMRGEGLDVTMHSPASGVGGRRAFTRDSIPPWLRGLAFRLDPSGALLAGAHRRRYRRALQHADAAWIWAASPEAVYLDVGAAGLPLFVERINCLRATARPILDAAYRRAGLPPSHGITDAAIEEELRKLARADWIFSPSPMVERSLLDAGVPRSKILPTSFGWSPERMEAVRRPRAEAAAPAFLFVGSICLRKGAHLLLDAWAAAATGGTLTLCGELTPEVAGLSARHLARPDVRAPGFVAAIGQAFADADVFAFPTLEEGGPQVTYEAASHGLAILTSPMGAGAIVRDGVEALVRDPLDADAWVEGLRRLAADPGLRGRLGAAARRRAQEFTWRHVGARRRAQVLAALESRGARRPGS